MAVMNYGRDSYRSSNNSKEVRDLPVGRGGVRTEAHGWVTRIRDATLGRSRNLSFEASPQSRVMGSHIGGPRNVTRVGLSQICDWSGAPDHRSHQSAGWTDMGHWHRSKGKAGALSSLRGATCMSDGQSISGFGGKVSGEMN